MTDDPTTQPGAGPPQVHAIERVDDAPEGSTIYSLAGELDLSCAEDLRAAIDGAGAERVILDLEEVVFIDSSVLKELLRANAGLTESGRTLVLVAPQAAVRRLLDLTRTASMFTIAPDRAAALG